MKILFASRKFDGVMGGVERMSTTLMNEMVLRGHDVHLFTWDNQESAQSFFPIDKSVIWHKLTMGDPAEKAGIWLRLRRAMKVRSILKSFQPDVVLAFQEGAFVTLKAYSIGLNIPMVCAIRDSPLRYAYVKATPPFWFTCLMLNFSAAITVQFKRYDNAFPIRLKRKIRVIGNHIFPSKNLANPSKTGDKIIFSSGRLSSVKNYSAMISAFSIVSESNPEWTLVIAGTGDERNSLQKQIDTLPKSIAQRIILKGAVKDIPAELEKAQIYAHSAKWEGFPNSVAEAMAHGLPTVGYAECDGVCDLVMHNKTGLLAAGNDNMQTFAASLEKLMRDESLRTSMGKSAHEYTKQFSPEHIFNQWEEILQEAARK